MAVYFKKDRNKWCASYRGTSKLFDSEKDALEFDMVLKNRHLEIDICNAPESRKAAIASGSITYKPEKKCAKGHVSARYTKNRKCVACMYEEKDEEEAKRRSAEWKQRNKDRVAAKTAERRAKLLRATPSWADKNAMQGFYRESKRLTELTGIDHHVDHIVPLISELVCGLHCESNLQVSTKQDNLAKSNKYWPDMP